MSTDNNNQKKTPPVVIGAVLAFAAVCFFILAAAVSNWAERALPGQAPAQTIPVQSSSEVELLYTVTIDGVEFDVVCDGTILLYAGQANHGIVVAAVGDSPKCQD